MAPWPTLLATLALTVASYTANAQEQQALAKCSLLGPQYPKPTGIASSPTFQSAMQSIGDTLDAGLSAAPYNTTAFSIGVFSASEPGLAWQYHNTPALLSNSTEGTNSVDADAVYRIGSISKLLTVFTFLIEAGDTKWNDPVINYLPELAEFGGNTSYAVPKWDEITLGDLAGQTAGLGRDYGLADLSNNNSLLPSFVADLVPQLPEDEKPVCNYVDPNGTFVQCSEHQYLQGVANSGTIFQSATRTVYSNQAFAILGLALSRIAGKPVEQLFDEDLVDALDLQSTSFTVPSNATIDHAVIPRDAISSGWSNAFGVFTPAGGNFASTNDFATIGRAILNSELLPTAVTRRWLKHVSLVNDPQQAVGLPWEIIRLQVLNRTVDVYGKAGDWGAYSTLFALMPDYDIGMTLFTAFDPLSVSELNVRSEVINLIAQPLVEAVDAIAKAQAADNFAGTYTSTETNSSVTITTDADSALRLIGWTYEGKDFYNDLVAQVVPETDWRLLPNDLYSDASRLGFTSFFQSPAPATPILGPCFNWASVDPFNFGNVPLGQFAFHVGEDGRATALESLGLRVTLERQG